MSEITEAAASEIIKLLRTSNHTLAVAESITGGMLGGAITSVAGSSDVFIGGIVAYNVRIKSELLAVAPELIAAHGVVSREVAIAMAAGVQRRLGSDWAIATTGVAGPGPSGGVAAGTVWIAIAGPEGATAEPLVLPGDREAVRMAAIDRALGAFTRILRG